MAQYDITSTITKYIDRHMVLPLLEWLQETELYPKSDIAHAKLELASKTKAVDLAIKEYKALYGVEEVPEALNQLRASVLEELKTHKEACGKLYDVVKDTELLQELQNQKDFNMEFLTKNYGVTEENLDNLYKYAKLSFDCGQYGDGGKYLSYFMLLSKDTEKVFWAQWGRLASFILEHNFVEAHRELEVLQRSIDERKSEDALEQLQQRTWLIHWSMFILLSLEDGPNMMAEFLFQEKLLNAIQTNCPHILRYLTVAVILNKRRNKNMLKDLVRVLVAEKEQYSDPITEFLVAIYVDFNFELAHLKLKECQVLLKHEYFLGFVEEDFMKSARQLVFDTYCRIHRCIDISTLVQQLNINEADAEPAIVELIREAGVNAKIDSSKNQIVMTTRTYNQVIDRTKGLVYRTKQLTAQMEKKYSEKTFYD